MAERRILLLVTDLEIGGTPTVVRELATRLHDPKKGVAVEVACLAKWGPVADQIRDAGVAVMALNATRAWQLPFVVRQLIRLIRQDRIDTVFSFLIHANAVAAAARPFCRGVRFIQSIQTTQPTPRWHWKLQRRVQRAAEKVVVPSESVAFVARQWAEVPAGRIEVIPNAIDPDAYPRSSVPQADPRPYPIGFIGRLDAIKRLDLLLLDIKQVELSAPRLVHLHIYGDGRERVRIERQIRRQTLGHVVSLHGPVSRPQDALSQLGLLVLRSDAEGFGLVLIEAMAAGVPVIGTDVPGIRHVIRKDETGLLVQPSSPVEMMFAIRKIVEDRALRSRLIENGLMEVRNRFCWDVVLDSYRQLLELV